MTEENNYLKEEELKDIFLNPKKYYTGANKIILKNGQPIQDPSPEFRAELRSSDEPISRVVVKDNNLLWFEMYSYNVGGERVTIPDYTIFINRVEIDTKFRIKDLKNNALRLSGITFGHSLNFIDCRFQCNFEIKGCEFGGKLSFLNVTGNHINVNNSNKLSSITLESSLDKFSHLGGLKISSPDENPIENVQIKNSKINQLNLSGYFKEVSLINVEILDLDLNNCNIEKLTISTIENLLGDKNDNFNPGKIDRLTINLEKGEKVDYKISDMSIETIRLTGKISKDSEIGFTYIQDVKQFQFNQLANFGSLKLGQIEFKDSATFRIEEGTDIGNAQFFGIDFSNLSKFELTNSKISASQFAFVKLPKKAEVYLSDDKVELFNQLKKVLIDSKIDHQARRIHLFEMEALKNDKSNLTKPELWSLYFNSWTNDHGHNWFKAFAWTGVSIVGFYSIFLLFLGYSVAIDKESWEEFGKVIVFIPEFINPVKSPKDAIKNLLGENTSDFPSLAIITAYVGKFLSSLFIYQLIAAFRKFGKNSG